MRIVLGALAVLASTTARADDFVTLDRLDGNSRAGVSAAYLAPGDRLSGGTLLHLTAHGRYVDPDTGLGGYLQAPFSYARVSGTTTTAFGDIEGGVVYVPALAVPDLGLVLHAGMTAPTAQSGTAEAELGVDDAIPLLADLYDALPRGLTARAGISLLYRQPGWFAQIDAGFDWNFDMRGAIGKGIHYNAGVGTMLGKTALMLESTNLSIIGDTPGTDPARPRGITFNALAVSARADVGRVLPYVAIIVPLEQDSSRIYTVTLVGGVDFKL